MAALVDTHPRSGFAGRGSHGPESRTKIEDEPAGPIRRVPSAPRTQHAVRSIRAGKPLWPSPPYGLKGRAFKGSAPLAELRRLSNPVLPGASGGSFRTPELEVEGVLSSLPESALEEAFGRLAARWREETEHLSSTGVFTHPDYQRIIGFGIAIVPVLLRDLSRTGAHWFWALRAITGENPVRAEDAGNVRKMIQAPRTAD